MPSPPSYPRERIEAAARRYHTTKEAAAALDIRPGSFSRLCRRYGIETPRQRQQRRAQG